MSISMTVRNGTAVGQESLCRTCRHAHIQLGYSESEEEIRCGYFEQPRLVLFAVRQCSDYLSKVLPTLYEMQKMASIINVKKAKRRAGFEVATVLVSKCEGNSE